MKITIISEWFGPDRIKKCKWKKRASLWAICKKSCKKTEVESENKHEMETRNKETHLVQHANTERFQKSAIIHMQKWLNEYETEQNKSKVF